MRTTNTTKEVDNEGQRDIANHKISMFLLYGIVHTVHSITVWLAEDLFLLINP